MSFIRSTREVRTILDKYNKPTHYAQLTNSPNLKFSYDVIFYEVHYVKLRIKL